MAVYSNDNAGKAQRRLGQPNQEIALHLRNLLPALDPTDSWLVMLAEPIFDPARFPRGRGIEKS